MKLDPALAEVLSSLDPSAETPVEEMTPEDARRVWKEEMAAVAGAPLPVKSVSTHEAPGPAGPLAVRLYEPEGADGRVLPILVYYHGGGWIRGDLDTHDDVCRYLCHRVGCLVASVDYRIAPEHRFPAALEDCDAATCWVAENAARLGADPARLAIGGDSAGGNIACGVTLKARDRGGPAIAFQLLIYPATDLAGENRVQAALLLGLPARLDALLRRELPGAGGRCSRAARLAVTCARPFRPATGLGAYRRLRSAAGRGRGLCQAARGGGRGHGPSLP